METLSGQGMPEWLAQRAKISPDRLALTWGPDERWTYRDLSIRVEATSRRLRKAGLHPGDRLGLLAWNSPAVVQTIHAVARMGLVHVPLNARLTTAELRRQVIHASISALVYDEANEKIAGSLLASREAVRDMPLGNSRRSTPGSGQLPIRIEAIRIASIRPPFIPSYSHRGRPAVPKESCSALATISGARSDRA